MSAGEVVRSKYESAVGIHLIEVDEQTLELDIGGTNDAPDGPIDSQFAAKRSRGAREYGLKPRFVTLKWTNGAPAGYRGFRKVNVPILSADTFAAININDTGTYLGQDVEVTNKIDESILPGAAVLGSEAPAP